MLKAYKESFNLIIFSYVTLYYSILLNTWQPRPSTSLWLQP